MPLQVEFDDEFAEGGTPQIGGNFKNEAGTVTQPDSCTLTVWDPHSNTKILDGVDIISSVTAGVLAYRVTAPETTIQNTDRPYERRHYLFKFAVSGIANRKEALVTVRNFRYTT